MGKNIIDNSMVPVPSMYKEEFISEYIKLCKKYNLIVDSCGCCDSPWLSVCHTNEDIKNHGEHLLKEEITK